MGSLHTAAMGLVILLLDVPPDSWDWVADPVGWILVLMGLAPLRDELPDYRALSVAGWFGLAISVLIYSPNSVATIDESLGWLFSLPALAFWWLLCRALAQVTDPPLAARFTWIGHALVAVAAVPLLGYVADVDWVGGLAWLLALVTHLVLLFALWAAGDEDDHEGFDAEKVRRNRRG